VGVWLMLAVAVMAVATSGPLMAAAAVPALAIAFWRNAMASAVLLPVTAVAIRRGRVSARLDPRTRLACAGSGLLLAGHFATWVPSVTLTSVATATALVSTSPIWTAMLAARAGRPVGRQVWIGILVAVAGAVLVTGADVTVSAEAVFGDVLALIGGVFAAAYMTVGERVRATVSTTVYTAICYPVCAAALLLACLVGGVRLAGYEPAAWLLLAAVTIGPQFLGHSLFNRVLDSLSATVVSVAALLEVPGAALLALVFLDQVPTLLALPGLALLLVGVGVVLLGMRSTRPVLPEV
jgi:drug/metabolite transporter (DMT)-like permease